MKKLVFALILVSTVLAVFPGADTAQAGACGPRICPEIYAPVICDNGKVYPNQCYADRNCARNCVPYGPGPIPL